MKKVNYEQPESMSTIFDGSYNTQYKSIVQVKKK
ncbi:hypothetical protein LMG33818_001777 [Halomonadaceae bacterium LMG 33818]